MLIVLLVLYFDWMAQGGKAMNRTICKAKRTLSAALYMSIAWLGGSASGSANHSVHK
jgi:hypothetical protein